MKPTLKSVLIAAAFLGLSACASDRTNVISNAEAVNVPAMECAAGGECSTACAEGGECSSACAAGAAETAVEEAVHGEGEVCPVTGTRK